MKNNKWSVCLLAACVGGCGPLKSDDEPPPEPKGNLLVNGSFEYWSQTGPAGWEMDQTGRVEPEGTAVHGHICVALTCLLPDEHVVLRQTVAAEDPGAVRASVRVKVSVPTRGAALVLDALDAEGKRLGGAAADIRGQPGDWRAVGCGLRCPAGTAALRYEIRLGPGASGQMVVDFARLERPQAPTGTTPAAP